MPPTPKTPAFQAVLHTLSNADGSAMYTAPNKTHTIIAGVNYPVEVPYRSDEIPESTFIEVNLRPHNGVGMVKERHVEEIVKRSLQTAVLGEETPRAMLQVTLQVTDMEVDERLPGGVKGGGQGESHLNLLAGSLNASILGCLDAGVRMKQLIGAVLVGIDGDGKIWASPPVAQRKRCTSMHVFGFGSRGDCVLMESEGTFPLEQWEEAEKTARVLVLDGLVSQDGDVKMVEEEPGEPGASVMAVMRKSVETRVENAARWREG